MKKVLHSVARGSSIDVIVSPTLFARYCEYADVLRTMLVVNDYVLKDTCESRQDVLPHFVRVRCTYIAGILRTMMMVNEHLKNCNRIVELLFFKQIVRGSFTGVIVNR